MHLFSGIEFGLCSPNLSKLKAFLGRVRMLALGSATRIDAEKRGIEILSPIFSV